MLSPPSISLVLLAAAVLVAAAIALELSIDALRRRRHALRINRSLVPPTLPSLEGPLRDATCGALLGAALGDAAGCELRYLPPALAARLTEPRLRLFRPLWRRGRYGVRTQLMLAAARAIDRDGTLAVRRYRLELAFLARYAIGAPRPLRRALVRLRRGPLERHVASSTSVGSCALLVAVPLGAALHDRPAHAAALAAELVAQTHASVEVRQSAALLAAAVARSVQLHGTQGPHSLDARRVWIERVARDAGGPDGPAAIATLPVADLAAAPLAEVRARLRLRESALDVLVLGLQIALHRRDDIRAALRDAATLGHLAASVAAIALALIGARLGQRALDAALQDEDLARLQDRSELELHGEKLALVQPRKPVTTTARLAPRVRLRRRLTSGR